MTILGSPWGLLALLAIPVVLYLHRAVSARPRTVPLVALWRPGATPAAGAPRPRWRDPLLLVRLAIVSILALALAQPAAPGVGPRRHVIVLDAGLSMQASAAGRTRMDEAREAAARLLDHLPEGDEIGLVRAGATAEVAHAPAAGAPREALRQALAGLTATDSGKRLDPALALAARVLGEAGGSVHLFSDLAEPAGLRASAQRAQLGHVVLYPVGAPADNLAIVAADARPIPRSPLDCRVVARVASFARAERTVDVVVRPAGGPPQRRRLVLAPSARATVSVEVPAAPSVEVTLDSGGDALAVDDRVTLALPPTPVRVLYAGAGDRYLEAALQANPRVALRRVALDALPAAPPLTDVVVVNGRAPEGLALPALVFAGAETGAGAASLPVLPVAGHPLVRDLDLHGVVVPARAVLAADGVVALRSAAGAVMRVHEAAGTRRVELAFAAQDSSLGRLPAFPVLVARAVDWLAGDGHALNVRAGEPLEVPVAGHVHRAVVRLPGEPPREMAAREGRVTVPATTRTGLAAVEAGDRVVLAGVNVLDERESDVRRAPVALEIGAAAAGDRRWMTRPLLAGLLLLLPFEAWLARPRARA